MSHSFDLLVLLTSIPSETPILLNHNILILFIVYKDIQLKNLLNNICYFHARNFYHLV